MKAKLNVVLLTIFAISVVLPIVWTFVSSFKDGSEILGSPWAIPHGLKFANYVSAWTEGSIGRGLVNSLIVTIGTLLFLMPTGSMAAYVLAKYPFPGSKIVTGTFLGGMMFPHFLVIVPLFFMLKNLHLFDTRIGLIIVYVAYSLAFTIFVLTGFFHSLPDELAEAANLDGCGHSGTFWRIMLPLAKPGLIVVGIFDAIGLWNEYGLALALVPSDANRTLPLEIADMAMAKQYSANYGSLFAGLVIVMTPVLAIYWIFRDKIHETMLAGAVKG